MSLARAFARLEAGPHAELEPEPGSKMHHLSLSACSILPCD